MITRTIFHPYPGGDQRSGVKYKRRAQGPSLTYKASGYTFQIKYKATDPNKGKLGCTAHEKPEQGTVGVQFFCTWLSLKTSFFVVTKQPYVIYIYFFLHWQNHEIQSISWMLSAFCSFVLASNSQTKKTTLWFNQSWTSIELFFLLFFSFCGMFVFLFWFVSWMRKQKGKKLTALQKLFVFSRCFWNFCPTFQKPNGKKTTNQWRSMKGRPMSTSTQPHLTDIIQVCMFCWFAHRLGMPYATIVLSEIWHS